MSKWVTPAKQASLTVVEPLDLSVGPGQEPVRPESVLAPATPSGIPETDVDDPGTRAPDEERPSDEHGTP